MLLEAIKDYLEKNQENRETKVSMHNIGSCYRQLAFRHHKWKKDPYTWKSLLIFQDGHTFHDEVRKLIRKSLIAAKSCYRLIGQEEEVEFNGIIGHVDGILAHRPQKNSEIRRGNTCSKEECSGTSAILEAKSMGEYGYREFTKTGEVGKQYMAQGGAYMLGKSLTEWVLIAKRKATGELATRWYSEEETRTWRYLAKKRVDKINKVVYTSSVPFDVPQEHHPNKKGALPWECGYCPYVKDCWKDDGLKQIGEHKFTVEVSKS